MISEEGHLWLGQEFANAIPELADTGVIDWAATNIRLVGSVRSERFDVEITPWLRKAYEAIDHPDVKIMDLVMPAQSGKSAFGEILICYWIATKPSGDCQYNWPSDKVGQDRYRRRVFRILEACPPVKKLMPRECGPAKPLISFKHLNFTMQGVATGANLESESITLQINEEGHDWKKGRKKMADNRISAVWNSTQANISTGGIIGDDLDTTYKGSSRENWEEPCDECGEYQHFHAKAVDDKLGGLRYETTKQDDGIYDFPAIKETIYYECEHCGHKMFDNYELRRQRSLKGRYPNPRFAEHIGLHMEQVSVYWIPYLNIVQQKLEAISAMRRGDKQPWIVYIQRSEGLFYDARYRPHLQGLKLNNEIKKTEGLAERKLRGMTVDKQRGRISAGETPHYWVIIRDWISPMRSRLVWEGRRQTDEDVEELRKEFEVNPKHVLVDSGDKANDVYRMCLDYGYASIKGSGREFWGHKVGNKRTQRIYSPIEWIDPFFGTAKAGIHKVPLIHYSKHQIRDRLESIRSLAGERFEIPSNVSKYYQEHMVSEEKQEMEMRDGSSKMVWIQEAKRNDLFVCECYQTLLVDLCGLKNLPEDDLELVEVQKSPV